MHTDTKFGSRRVALIVSVALCVLTFGSEAGAQTAQPKGPPEAQPPALAPTVNARGWEVNCDPTDTGLNCFARQRLYRDKRRVGTVYVLTRANDPAPKLIIRLPLGTYLPAGTSIQFGESEAKQLLIEGCSKRGCYPSEYPLTEADIAAMLKGGNLTISVQDAQQKPLTFVVSAGNFPEAYKKIR